MPDLIGLYVSRRNLSIGERADAAAAICDIRPGKRRSSSIHGITQAEAADMFGISERSVNDAKAVAQYGDKRLKAQVKAGKISRKRAAAMVRSKRGKSRRAPP